MLTEDDVARLRAGVDAVIAAPSPAAVTDGEPGAPGTFFEDFCTWQHVPDFEQVIRESALAAAAGRLMRSREVRMFHDHILVKEPGTTTKTPWHQDQPFYCIDGSQTVSFWVPLDPVPRESTLEFVAGSNSGDLVHAALVLLGRRASRSTRARSRRCPTSRPTGRRSRSSAGSCEPGDAVAFNMLTLHAAAGSATRRRAFSLRLLGDDVRYAPRPHRTSPSFPGLDERLEAGAPMDDPLFPVLWPAS